MKPVAFEHAAPAGAKEAFALLAREGAKPLSGGQSLAPTMNLRLVRPALLVDVKGLPGLRGFVEHADRLRLGAATTHAEIEDGKVPDVTNGLMPHVAHGIAYRAVRNRGTIGGSLAHADPAGDWPNVMVALGATIVALSAEGERHIPASAFMTAPFATALRPGEIILAVEIPRLAGRWGYCKINRKIGEFAKAIGVAIERPRRLLAGAVDGPPVLLDSIGDIASRLAWLDASRQRLSAAAAQRAIAMMEAA